MSEELVEVVLSHAGQTRRSFMKKLVLGSAAFAVPAVASFSIGGSATPQRSPIQGASLMPKPSPVDLGCNTADAGSNVTDIACNTIDIGPNILDDGSNSVDEGSNTVDEGSNSGAGLPLTGELPPAK